MVEAFVAEIPVYAHLPRERLEGEIRQICRYNLQLLIRSTGSDDGAGGQSPSARRDAS
jgi:hypothetical protein